MCALLHDNALTQYISEELKKDSVINCKKDLSEKKTNLHCIYGEKNITKIPFKTDVSNVILYHHEHAVCPLYIQEHASLQQHLSLRPLTRA